MAANLSRLLLTGATLCIVFPALAAEILPDPTRPPNEILSSGVTTGKTRGAAPIPMHEGLQSIFISPQHRAAVIHGETVSLGEKIGGDTLVEVRETSVVLQGASGKRVIELFPEVYLNKGDLKSQMP